MTDLTSIVVIATTPEGETKARIAADPAEASSLAAEALASGLYATVAECKPYRIRRKP